MHQAEKVMDDENVEKRWYLIQCKSGQESRAIENLQNQYFECFKPEIISEKIKKGKLVSVKEPLFSGYIFIKLDKVTNNWSVIRSTRGVLRLVSFGNNPIPVDSEIIEKLKSRENWIAKPLFKKGDNISVVDGPFTQLDAIYQEMDGEKRAVVLLNIMNKWHRISLSFDQLSA